MALSDFSVVFTNLSYTYELRTVCSEGHWANISSYTEHFEICMMLGECIGQLGRETEALTQHVSCKRILCWCQLEIT